MGAGGAAGWARACWCGGRWHSALAVRGAVRCVAQLAGEAVDSVWEEAERAAEFDGRDGWSAVELIALLAAVSPVFVEQHGERALASLFVGCM